MDNHRIEDCEVINGYLYCWNEDHTQVYVSKATIDMVSVGRTMPTDAALAMAERKAKWYIEHCGCKEIK